MPRAALVALILLISACSITPPEGSPRIAYRQAESVQSLIVPPDLTRPQSPEALEISEPGSASNEVLPEFGDIRMVRAGPLQWLEVTDAAPGDLWPRMSGFLRSEGLTVRTQRPAEGLIETGWAERFDAVPRGGLAGFFDDVFGSVGSDNIRDKYQIRLERMDNGGGTRVFLTHWAATEVNTNPNTHDTPTIEVVRAEVDPAVAAEMRRRLLVYLGVTRERASRIVAAGTAEGVYNTPVRLVTTEGGVAYAEFGEENYRRAFGLLGEALRLIGAEVIETDERKGTLWVRWLPPREVRGSGLFSDDRPQRLFLQVRDAEEAIRVRAGDESGNVRSGKIQVALLERLVDVLGGDISSYREVEESEAPPASEAGPDSLY